MQGSDNLYNSIGERLPPQDLEAEKCVLASLMIASEPEDVDQIIEVLPKYESFYSADNQIIYSILLEMRRNKKPCDAVLLRAELEKRGLLEEVGGTAYIAQILGTVPSAAHGVYYGTIVKNMAMRRALISESNDLMRKAYAPLPEGMEYPDIFKNAAMRFDRMANSGLKIDVVRAGQAAREFLAERRQGRSPTIKTDIVGLDALIGGLPRAKFIIIGARPAVGKSLLEKQIILNIGKRNEPIGLVSIEETRSKIAGNMLSNQLNLANTYLMRGNISEEDFGDLDAGAEWLDKFPIHIADKPVKMSEVCATIEWMKRHRDIQAAFVDHIHIVEVDVDEDRRKQRGNDITRLSGALKMLAKRLGIPIVALAQLNRGDGTMNDWKRKPVLRDLRESGALEQDGDLIMLLHRDDYYRQNEPDYTPNHTLEVIVAKNKDGQTGTAALHWEPEFQRTTSLINQPEIPFI